MAEKRTINIDINNNADEAAKDFENFAKATNVANDSVEGLNKTFEEVYGEIQPLTTRMGEAEDRLYELSAAGDTASREYQQLLEKVGNYRKVQIETDLAVDQAAKTLSQKLGTALTGAASGFTAATGVIGLMGTESQELEKLLLKVNAAMAFQQGVEGIREYTKSVGLASKVTKAFNLIVKGNPLAIFLTIITSIVVSVLAFTDVLDQAIQMLKDFSDAVFRTNFEEDKLAEERNKRSRQHLENMKAEQTLRDAEIRQLEALGKSTTALRRQQIEEDKASLEATAKRLQMTQDIFQAIENEISGTDKKAKQNANQIKVQAQLIDLETELINLEKEEQQEVKNLDNTYADYAARRLSAARLIQDLELEILEDGVEKEVKISNVKFNRLLEDLKSNTELTAKERKRLKEIYLFQQQEAENNIRNKFRQKELEAQEEFGVESIDVSELYANKEVETTSNKYAAMGALSLQYYEDEEERRKRNKQFAIVSAFETLDLISNITELFGKKGEKQAKRAFEVQKATTLGTTYLSATQAYASQFLPLPDPSSPVRGGIAAGLAVASGLANVAKIASQKFEGGGATGGTSVSGSVPDAPTAPQFNVVGDSGVNQLAQLQQQPTQAYVVSGEVTTAQALDRNRVQNATL
jgi:hypothetical protein